MLQADPALEDVAVVIFDEFHERSLQADLGLALTLDARAQLNPQLRVLVMSATLDGAAVARLLGDAPLVSAPGRTFAVDDPLPRHAAAAAAGGDGPRRGQRRAARHADDCAGPERGARRHPGLPARRRARSAACRRTWPAAACRRARGCCRCSGTSPGELQDAALQPAAAGARKVVLATNIAETSLTIPGVRVVVDSGLMRRARFDPVTGMSRLETQRISRASADQRRGRAGRTEAGVCYRGWSEGAQASLAAFTSPEIAEADLAPLALELASWGTRDAAELRWLDPPPQAMLASARDLLQLLGRARRRWAHHRARSRGGAHRRAPAPGPHAAARPRRWDCCALPASWPPCCRSATCCAAAGRATWTSARAWRSSAARAHR